MGDKHLFEHREGSRFAAKDAVVLPILRSVEAYSDYRAVLMPCLNGPELEILLGKGVAPGNIFSIERDPSVHKIQRNPPPDLPHLHGIRTTYKPLASDRAVDHVHALLGPVDLIYLDFFGQPAYTHWTTLFKVFKLGLLRPGATILLTFGASRGEPFAARLNAALNHVVPAQSYVDSAIAHSGHAPYVSVKHFPYSSNRLPFITSRFLFS